MAFFGIFGLVLLFFFGRRLVRWGRAQVRLWKRFDPRDLKPGHWRKLALAAALIAAVELLLPSSALTGRADIPDMAEADLWPRPPAEAPAVTWAEAAERTPWLARLAWYTPERQSRLREAADWALAATKPNSEDAQRRLNTGPPNREALAKALYGPYAGQDGAMARDRLWGKMLASGLRRYARTEVYPNPAAVWPRQPPLLAAQVDKRYGPAKVRGPEHVGARAWTERMALRLVGEGRDRGIQRDTMICWAEMPQAGPAAPACRLAIRLPLLYDTYAPGCDAPGCTVQWTRPQLLVRVSHDRVEVTPPRSDSGPDGDTRWSVAYGGQERAVGDGLVLDGDDARAFVTAPKIAVLHRPAEGAEGLLWARRRPAAWPLGPRLLARSAPFHEAAVEVERDHIRMAGAITGLDSRGLTLAVRAIGETGRLLIQSMEEVHEDAPLTLSNIQARCLGAWRPRLSVHPDLRKDANARVLGSTVLDPIIASKSWDWERLVDPVRNTEACDWGKLSLWAMSGAIDALSGRGPVIAPGAPDPAEARRKREEAQAAAAKARAAEVKARLEAFDAAYEAREEKAREAARQALADKERKAAASAAQAPDSASSSAEE